MEKLEIHFFHGFLGEPSDWNSTINELTLHQGVEVHTHSLLDLYRSLDSDRSLQAAANKVQKDLLTSESTKKIVVGYSLGGRLLLHLQDQSFDKLLLLGSHPGLKESREQRLIKEAGWVEKGQQLSQQEWLAEWNRQDVFASDRSRPRRQFTDADFNDYIEILQAWSVARQEDFRKKLQSVGNKIFWACGEDDTKYRALSEEMKEFLPKDHVWLVPGAGHGILFDQPQDVARMVEKVATYDR